MIQFRLYEDGDMDKIVDAVDPLSSTHEPEKYIEQGLFLTVLEDDVPVATGGLLLTDVDTAEAWIKVSRQFVSQSSIKSRIQALRTFSEALGIMDDCLGFPNLFGRVMQGFAEGERMAKFMGFIPTGESMEMDGQKYNYVRRTA